VTEQEKQLYMAWLMRQEEEKKQSSQGGGPPPGSMQVAQQFMGGGEAAAGSGGGGGGGAMAGAAPWAALAAAIAINESEQNKAGNRPDSRGNRLTEGLTGESLTRDVDRLTGDNKIAGWAADHGNPKGLGRNMEKGLKPWELFKDWF